MSRLLLSCKFTVFNRSEFLKYQRCNLKSVILLIEHVCVRIFTAFIRISGEMVIFHHRVTLILLIKRVKYPLSVFEVNACQSKLKQSQLW